MDLEFDGSTAERIIRDEITNLVREAARMGQPVHILREALRMSQRFPRMHSTDEYAGMIVRACAQVPGLGVDASRYDPVAHTGDDHSDGRGVDGGADDATSS